MFHLRYIMGRGNTISTISSSKTPSEFPLPSSILALKTSTSPSSTYVGLLLGFYARQVGSTFSTIHKVWNHVCMKRAATCASNFFLSLCKTCGFACKTQSRVTWNPTIIQNTSSNNAKLPQEYTQDSRPMTIALQALLLVRGGAGLCSLHTTLQGPME